MNISKGTITRTVLLVLALFNQVLAIAGLSPLPFENETITECVSLLITGVTSGIAWWKNNSFTGEAIKADEYLEELKGE